MGGERTCFQPSGVSLTRWSGMVWWMSRFSSEGSINAGESGCDQESGTVSFALRVPYQQYWKRISGCGNLCLRPNTHLILVYPLCFSSRND